MTVNEDLEFRKLIEQEKEKISADLGDFVKFLAYTREDGCGRRTGAAGNPQIKRDAGLGGAVSGEKNVPGDEVFI